MGPGALGGRVRREDSLVENTWALPSHAQWLCSTFLGPAAPKADHLPAMDARPWGSGGRGSPRDSSCVSSRCSRGSGLVRFLLFSQMCASWWCGAWDRPRLQQRREYRDPLPLPPALSPAPANSRSLGARCGHPQSRVDSGGGHSPRGPGGPSSTRSPPGWHHAYPGWLPSAL